MVTLLASTKSAAQTKTASTTKKTSFAQQTDSLKLALNNVKTSMNTIFKAKRDTVSIAVSGVDYDDANLSHLKDNLKKVKGVKSVAMQYKDSLALMKVCYKGKATDLWDNVPPDSKEQFKILEASDENLKLKSKNEKGAAAKL